jgi:two-component system, LytTR family, response regulator
MSAKYTVVIVDDLKMNIFFLEQALKSFNQIQIAGTASCSETAEQLIMTVRPDLLFLDVELADDNGFDFHQKIKDGIDWQMYIVIYSSHEKYMINAIRFSYFDFLKKPFEKIDLTAVMNHFFEEKRKNTEYLQIALPKTFLQDSKFMVATITGTQILQLDQVLYIEYDKKNLREQWYVVLVNKTRLTLKRNSTAETIMKYSTLFVQINQRQIININYLSKIEGNKCILQKPYNNDKDLIISRTFYKLLQQKIPMI